ncbi:MAG TPA: LptA/OstA family protein [Bacillota bacterium]|jgi:lipopolysaccharide assembly outer membrane protein LptD (OstA)|nr:LptA/OstA family protein [Bacillota bacterium]
MCVISGLGSRKVRIALGLALFALLAPSVLGAEAAKEKVQVTAKDKVTVDLDTDVTVFEGSVRIAYGDVEIMAERAEVKERKTAHLSGNVKLIQPDVVLTGEVFTAYINEKRVVAEGGVVLTKEEVRANEGPDSSLEKDTVVITCDKMDLSTKTRGFTAEGNVQVRRGSSFAKADEATYRESEKVVLLMGNVSAEGKNGESIKCGKLIFRTDKDYMEAEEEVVFEFEIDEDTNDQTETG